MMNRERMEEFINFGFVPFCKSQCIKRLLCIWLFSAVLCFVGGGSKGRTALLCAAAAITTALFITLIVRLSADRMARFLCDGVFYLHAAILLNAAAYLVITLQIGPHPLLLLIFSLLLAACIAAFSCITLRNIQNGKFSEKSGGKRAAWLPLLGGACGVAAAAFFLHGQSQKTGLTVLATALFTLSLVLSIPSIQLLRAVVVKCMEKGARNHEAHESACDPHNGFAPFHGLSKRQGRTDKL